MAPEQTSSTSTVDARADLYSFGVVIYEILSGQLPAFDYTPPSKCGADPRWDRIVSRCLKTNPDDRYSSAAELLRDLQQINASKKPLRGWIIAALILLTLVATALLMRFPTEAILPVETPLPADILTSPDYEWSLPENLGPGVNSGYEEATPYVTADGLTILFRSDRPGGEGESDLWQCTRRSIEEPFANPVNLGPMINSSRGEDAPCLSANELTLYFASTNGNAGFNFDIFRANRDSKLLPWKEPERLPEPINSQFAEFRPWLSRDGLRLTFTSLRPPGEGNYIAERDDVTCEFGPPRPFGPDFNSRQFNSISFSWDDRTLMGNRLNAHFPGNLLWLARVDDPANPLLNLISFGPIVNSPAIDVSPVASPDGRVVYFSSTRPGGYGRSDLWQTRRMKKRS
ncbi:hypothetical protein BH11PLA2_BH11PLA2_45430 [soil metagenome]